MADNTEYFLLASYSCLLSVTSRLDQLRQKGSSAVLFCLTEPLYAFLRPLAVHFPQIKIHFIKDQPTWRIRQPLTLLRARAQTKNLYHQWFAGLPEGSIVHFYNRHAALFLFYTVWHLHTKCQMHYTECDMVDMYAPYWSLRSATQQLFFYFVYPIPIEIVRPSNKQSAVSLPAISAKGIQQIVTQTHERILTAGTLQSSPIYKALQWRTSAKILWIMSMALDMGEIEETAYEALLAQCYALFSASEQIVKFHPRASHFERFGADSVNTVPTHIPAEFLQLEGITAVITISSTSNTAWSLTPNVNIISLVELLPFVNETIRERHRQAMQQATTQYFAPTTPGELWQILGELNIEA
ncbi:MAG: hypothetical protein GY796_23625 [Chloroflexi bacterium]|nr:hypothetical protein [Chloroflexota bacterium]